MIKLLYIIALYHQIYIIMLSKRIPSIIINIDSMFCMPKLSHTHTHTHLVTHTQVHKDTHFLLCIVYIKWSLMITA